MDRHEPNAENDGDDSQHNRIEQIPAISTLNLRSQIPRPDKDKNCLCLSRFHNCTPHRITPYWIDFKGLPIDYPVLARGASINIDTYSSQLWFFKAQDVLNSSQNGIKRVLAIPEEAIDLTCNASRFGFLDMIDEKDLSLIENKKDDHPIQYNAMRGSNSVLVCSLCKYILNKYSKAPAKIPCPHYTGETKLSASDLDPKSRYNYNSLGTYIYSCSELNHQSYHSTTRHNIYLVEAFHNLRERCFLTLSQRLIQPDVTKLQLPASLQQDFIKFVTTIKKVNDGCGVKDII